uniref:RRM domain-containing protein n=1 Tax=Panagrolaimus davidi TaxID=227884 RepID=A0A914P771_9BILA
MMDENESSDSESGGHHSGHSGQVKQKRMESAKHEEKKDDKDEHHCTDLIVLGLPFKLTEKDLEEHFGQFGKLTLCEIKKDGKGASKGFGFIQFENFESQLRVLTRPVHTIGGRRCEKGDGRSEYGGIEHAKLFIGRLQEKTSEASLKEFFLNEARKIDPKANIIDTFIPKPFRSFAFITFSSPKIVKEMIKKGDFIIDGSSVSVSSAAPKTTESSSSHSSYASERLYQDYPYSGEWSRSTMHRPTTQFNEQAFVRPYGNKNLKKKHND